MSNMRKKTRSRGSRVRGRDRRNNRAYHLNCITQTVHLINNYFTSRKITNHFLPLPDPPGKPGKPKATNWDKDFVDLEWTKPKDDGGAEITQYVVEKRDVVSSER